MRRSRRWPPPDRQWPSRRPCGELIQLRLEQASQTTAANSPQPTDARDLPEALQERLCADLLDSRGCDPRRCQRARSAHPFSSTEGPQDFRITTRVVRGQPLSAFLASAHEWGHSLYGQGLSRNDDHFFPWPLGEATPMAVHESQSLFWECRVAPQRDLRPPLGPPVRGPGRRGGLEPGFPRHGAWFLAGTQPPLPRCHPGGGR